MVNLKNPLFIFIGLIAIFVIHSCKIELNPISINQKDQLLNKLTTTNEKNFFDPTFILHQNNHVRPSIVPRGFDEYIDSLFNELVRLQLSEPYAEELIDFMGYPIWSQAIDHPQVDSLYQTITIPF